MMGAGPMAAAQVFARPAQWRALRTISTALKVVAWLILCLGIIFALVALAATSNASSAVSSDTGSASASGYVGAAGGVGALFIFIIAALGFLFTYAYAEVILVFITIEYNTRG